MRGYFGVGVEGISKSQNAGALFRTAHAFGASFVFTVDSHVNPQLLKQSDTSVAEGHVPLYEFGSSGEMMLPKGCQLVGVELTDDAVELPSFRHPNRAAYIMGPERGNLSEEMLARCDFAVQIPTKFCINVSLAGALVMYDRTISLGRFAPRPVRVGGPTEGVPEHVHGAPIWARKEKRREKERESG
ncbi:MAG: RNA methyltransferase [Pseudomonadota bacterium]